MIKEEIEKRFLLKNAPTREQLYLAERYLIEQFYLLSEKGVCRYRKTTTMFVSTVHTGAIFERIIKKNIGFGINQEINIEQISDEEYEENKKNAFKIIRKIREVYPFKGLRFEIDSFKTIRLVICEVELENINQAILFPEFIQNEIIYEVTGINEFSNYNLAYNINSFS